MHNIDTLGAGLFSINQQDFSNAEKIKDFSAGIYFVKSFLFKYLCNCRSDCQDIDFPHFHHWDLDLALREICRESAHRINDYTLWFCILEFHESGAMGHLCHCSPGRCIYEKFGHSICNY